VAGSFAEHVPVVHAPDLIRHGADLYGTGPLATGTVSDGESPAQTLNWVLVLNVKAPPPPLP
jgi:hypothetical protein